jgi:phosphohistidine phosphatase
MLAVVRDLGGDALHVMVFGHNPGITEFANKLSAGEQIDNLPTCGVFTATFDIAGWDALDWGLATDGSFDYPKNAG